MKFAGHGSEVLKLFPFLIPLKCFLLTNIKIPKIHTFILPNTVKEEIYSVKKIFNVNLFWHFDIYFAA